LSWRKFLLASLLACLLSSPALADGQLTHLTGKVRVQKALGSLVDAKKGMAVQQGDSLITGDDGYVRVLMSDGGQMVLRSNTEIKIDTYHFEQEQPDQDRFVFSALKGGLRAITGLISKRGKRDAYQANTHTATIGIRGTEYDLDVCEPRPDKKNDCDDLAEGAYLAVIVGAIVVTNELGYVDLMAGQFGFAPPNLPPVVLTRDPGVSFMLPAGLDGEDDGALECSI